MKISIIIPTYNRAYCIERAIASIGEGTMDDYEIIVVDDGSTDSTKDIIEKLCQGNKKIRYFRMEENRGVCVARNYGVEHAQGEWVMGLDSDDLLVPDALSVISEYVSKYTDMIAFAFANRDERRGCTVHVKNHQYVMKDWKEYFDKSVKDGEFQFVVKRELLLKFPLYEELNGFEGIRWYNLEKQYYSQIMFTDTIVGFKDVTTTDSLMRGELTKEKAERQLKGMELRLSVMGEDLKKYQIWGKDGLAMSYAVIGRQYIILRRWKEGMKYTFMAWIRNPLELRAYRNILILFSEILGINPAIS